MNRPAFHDIFPLPLTPFEEYMFLDAHSGYPMVVPVTLVFKGNVRFEILSNAFDETVASEPLFHALVQKVNRRFCWIDSGLQPKLIFTDANPIDPNLPYGIDEFKNISIAETDRSETDHGETNHENPQNNQAGFRCSFTPHDGGFVIRLRIHHAVCDGMAVLLFVANWFAKYAQMIGDKDEIDTYYPSPIKIKERSNLSIKYKQHISKLASTLSFYRSTRDWFSRYLCRIRNCNPQFSEANKHLIDGWLNKNFFDTTDNLNHTNQFGNNQIDNDRNTAANADDNSNSKLIWSRLPEELANAIQSRLNVVKVGLSPFIMAEYFRFVQSWMLQSDSMPVGERRNWIRVLYPTNFRLPLHRSVPAANILGFAFIDRKFNSDFRNDNLYFELHNTLTEISNMSMGAMFLTGIELCCRIPFLLKRILTRRCLTSTIFTTIGNPCIFLPQKRFRRLRTIKIGNTDSVNDIELLRIIGSPPLRPGTPVSFAMTKQPNEITFSNLIDVSSFGLKNAVLFHNLFIDHLKKAVS
jgi:NRPS condensation-like uncharacterized protein